MQKLYYESKKRKRQKVYRGTECHGDDEAEWKYIDITQTNSDITTTGKVHLDTVNVPVQGAGVSERIGDTIFGKKLEVRVLLSQQDGTGNDKEDENCDLFRLTIVRDKQCNKTAPVYTDVFLSTSIISPIKHENRGRFEILYSKVHKIRSYGNIQATTITPKWDRDYVYFEKMIYFDDLPIDFSASTGAVTDLNSNNIFILGQGANTNNVKGQIDMRTRFYYIDN